MFILKIILMCSTLRFESNVKYRNPHAVFAIKTHVLYIQSHKSLSFNSKRQTVFYACI